MTNAITQRNIRIRKVTLRVCFAPIFLVCGPLIVSAFVLWLHVSLGLFDCEPLRPSEALVCASAFEDVLVGSSHRLFSWFMNHDWQLVLFFALWFAAWVVATKKYIRKLYPV